MMYGCINNKCEPCKTCSNCTSDTTWLAVGAGYQMQTVRWCTCGGICESATNYRCAAGYYGTAVTATTGCTQCPNGDSRAGTSAPGANHITKCYIPQNLSVTNNSGSYTYENRDCYYTGQ